jgi:hypothetical protein
MKMSGNNTVSRRKFIAGAGFMALGTIAAQFSSILSNAEAKTAPIEKWPWPYVKLDPAQTAELAYNEWYRVFCGAAVISSVFSQLREKVGEPYKSFPIDSFLFLEGGVTGWGTICGAPMGANIVSNMIIGPRIAGSEDGALMGSEMLDWYANAEMPIFTPRNPRIKTVLLKTVSDSPLCHISVGKWMKAADKDLKSAERKDRCARVAASTAYHVVELLNSWRDGKYETHGTVPSANYGITAQSNCTECHGSNIPTPPIAKLTGKI